jgi:hypothetical protein
MQRTIDKPDTREREHPDPSRDVNETPTPNLREHAQGARARWLRVQRRRHALNRTTTRTD